MNVLKGLKSQETVFKPNDLTGVFRNEEYMKRLDIIGHLIELHLKVTTGYKSKNLKLIITGTFMMENDSIYKLDKIIEKILIEKSIQCILEQENLIVEDLRTGKQTILC